MDLAADSEEAAEAHEERLPALRVDVGLLALRAAGGEQRFVDVQARDVDLEGDRADVLAERAVVVDDPLHLHRALQHPRRRHALRRHRRQAGLAELLPLVAIAPGALALRYRVLPRGERQAVDRRDLVDGRQVDHALARADQIVRGLPHAAQTEHAGPAQPPGRRHRREIRRAVFVQRRDEGDRRSEIEDGRFDRLVHAARLAWRRPDRLPESGGQSELIAALPSGSPGSNRPRRSSASG